MSPRPSLALLFALSLGAPRAADLATPDEEVAPVAPEAAPAPGKRLSAAQPFAAFEDQLRGAFEGWPSRSFAIQVDRPLYRPGETIWLRAWDLERRSLSAAGQGQGLEIQLINPKGATVLSKKVAHAEGLNTNDLEIPAGVPGGEYLVRVLRGGQLEAERPVIVAAYEAPRLKKKLEFLRKAYGPGDTVVASVNVKRPTGEVLASRKLTAAIQLDGQALPRVEVTTDARGDAVVRFELPARISRGDGLLTVLVEDGGVTESVSKRIPIVLQSLDVSLYPEGGDLVIGLPSRVYFEARDPIGKPADVEGRLLDDTGAEIATFQSHRDGLGRFGFVPQAGRAYHVEITRPAGIAQRYDLPAARTEGCVLRTFDDLDGSLDYLRVAVRCSAPRVVSVQEVLREQLIDGATVQARPDKPAVVYLQAGAPASDRAMGIARVTVFGEDMQPLAERLVFRNRRQRLNVEVTPARDSYQPREQVTLDISTTDPMGRPVAADLALAVVDDTVLSFADDKHGHLLSRLLLEQELADEVEEPNFYLDLTEEKSALALELLMGTRGWRRFDWQQALVQPQVPEETLQALVRIGYVDDMMFAGGMPAMAVAEGAPRGGRGREKQAEARIPMAPPPMAAAQPVEAPAAAADMPAPPPVMARELDRRAARGPALAMEAAEEERWAGNAQPAWQWAPVRVFPAPIYTGAPPEVRTDFRDTVHWAPRVQTDAQGHAQVSFYTSDAITSFRVTTEGTGGGFAGRDETVIRSNLPFSMAVKIPLAVSEGDRLRLPLTLSNERQDSLALALEASFPQDLLTLQRPIVNQWELPGEARESLFMDLLVTGKEGTGTLAFHATSAGLSDAFEREIDVAPLGFPQAFEASGELTTVARHTVDLGQAIDGTVSAKVQLYPSPVATLVSGMEGLIREPGGCFEQTSSSNYPNVMVLRYLEEQGVADPEMISRTLGMLDRGYQRLVGYESPEKGYEWFGGDPGHEALTAYGLLEFQDMRGVFGDVDAEMMARTADWLMSRRDGAGGFQRDPKALDSFGRASAEVTDAYIVWSLAEAGFTDGLDKELSRQAALARSANDPYLLALATGTLTRLDGKQKEAGAAARRLAGLQAKDGSFPGADHSITRSGGEALTIESTALATMALLQVPGHDAAVRQAVDWLNQHRGGFGQWGSTQATVLSLRAMTAYASASRATRGPGEVQLRINGKTAGHFAYEAGHRDAIVFEELGGFFASGANTIELALEGEEPLPYSIAVEYRSTLPASSPEAVMDLETRLASQQVKMGENVRLTATVRNRTEQGQPMTLARIGLPGGLQAQTWQLEDLRDRGLVDFFETGPREVVLYFRDFEPEELRTVPLDLVAAVPGTYTGPASSAYLYYTNEHKDWAEPLRVTVEE
ncbi:MAG: MG2 domain-containing protein [Pseudomonadota bacterium]